VAVVAVAEGTARSVILAGSSTSRISAQVTFESADQLGLASAVLIAK
jgi:hypothetical protein